MTTLEKKLAHKEFRNVVSSLANISHTPWMIPKTKKHLSEHSATMKKRLTISLIHQVNTVVIFKKIHKLHLQKYMY
jgi:hypothetical protein